MSARARKDSGKKEANASTSMNAKSTSRAARALLVKTRLAVTSASASLATSSTRAETALISTSARLAITTVASTANV